MRCIPDKCDRSMRDNTRQPWAGEKGKFLDNLDLLKYALKSRRKVLLDLISSEYTDLHKRVILCISS